MEGSETDVDLGLLGLLQLQSRANSNTCAKYLHPGLTVLLFAQYMDHKAAIQNHEARRGLQIIPEWNYKIGLYRYRLQTREPRDAIVQGVDYNPCLLDQQNIISLRKRTIRLIPFCNEFLINQGQSFQQSHCPLPHNNEGEKHLLYSYVWLFHARDGLFDRYESAAENELEQSFRNYLGTAEGKRLFQNEDLIVQGQSDDLEALINLAGSTAGVVKGRSMRKAAAGAAVVPNSHLLSEICYNTFQSRVRVNAACWDICRIGTAIHKITDVTTGTSKWVIRQSLVMGRDMMLQYSLGTNGDSRTLRAMRRHEEETEQKPFEAFFRELSFAFRLRTSERGFLGCGEVEYKPRKESEQNLSRLFRKLLINDERQTEQPDRCAKRRRIHTPSASDVQVLVESASEADGLSKNQSSESDVCSICLDDLMGPNVKSVRLPHCTHWFHEDCIIEYVERGCLKRGAIQCPLCSSIQLSVFGPSPKGKMSWQMHPPGARPITGHERHGSVQITYSLPSGRQVPGIHPCPGREYLGCVRVAWLPISKEGLESLLLLSKCFLAGQTFKLDEEEGESVVRWNMIPHKVNRFGGGPHGFPDTCYFKTLRESCLRHGVRLSDNEINQALQAHTYLVGAFKRGKGSNLDEQQPSGLNVMTQKQVTKAVINEVLRTLRPDIHLDLSNEGFTSSSASEASSDDRDDGADDYDDEEDDGTTSSDSSELVDSSSSGTCDDEEDDDYA